MSTNNNVALGAEALRTLQEQLPHKSFRLNKKGVVQYQTSGGRWLRCCAHGSQVGACKRDECAKSGDYCGCVGARGAKTRTRDCAVHGGQSLCQHGKQKNFCKTAPCFGASLCAVCGAQESKCGCGTGGHICECGCGKRRGLCAVAKAKKESGELPQHVTQRFLEKEAMLTPRPETTETTTTAAATTATATTADAQLLKSILDRSQRDGKTGCLLFSSEKKPLPSGKIAMSSLVDGESTVDRIVYRIKTGKPAPKSVPLLQTCGNGNCIEISHLQVKQKVQKNVVLAPGELEQKATNATALLKHLTEKFPQSVYRIHKSKLYVEKQRGDGNYRRVCKHNKAPRDCRHCVVEFVADKSIARKGAKLVVFGPKTFADASPFGMRPEKKKVPEILLNATEMANHKAALERIMSNVAVVKNDKMEKDCLRHNASADVLGRTTAQVKHDGAYLTHTVVWQATHGRKVPKGFEVLHKCNSGYFCCEPSHLEVGTHRQNMFEDKIRDGTLQHGEKHHNATMSNELALAIFQSKGTGTRAERAVRFGVPPRRVKRIDTGDCWSHVTGMHRSRNKERERSHAKRLKKSDLTREHYENAMKLLDARSRAVDNGKGCIESTYVKNAFGYAEFSVGGVSSRAHIASWEYHHNDCRPKPTEMQVMHSCDNPACHNPAHLSLGTNSDNQQQRWKRTGWTKKRGEKRKGDFCMESLANKTAKH